MLSSLFPPFVTCESVRYAPGDEARFGAIPLPPEVDRAVAKRRLEFLAGRACAMAAIRRLLPAGAEEAIPVGVDRAPLWPRGIVGAITHTEGFAAAAVALSKDADGVGLDSERVVAASAMEAVAEQAVTPEELRALARAGLGEAVLLTIVFSAKESLFKCLSPRVGRYFDFRDATIVDVSEGARTFVAELRTQLGGLRAGSQLGGRFALAEGFVHTGIALPR